jgi:hypothetical protein
MGGIVTLTRREIVAIIHALVESCPELCWVPSDTSPDHLQILANLPPSDMSDDAITNFFQKLVRELTT